MLTVTSLQLQPILFVRATRVTLKNSRGARSYECHANSPATSANAFNKMETLELIYCYCFYCLFAGYLKPRNTTVYFDTT